MARESFEAPLVDVRARVDESREGSSMKVATSVGNVFETSERLEWLNSEEAARYLRKTLNALHIMVRRGYVKPRKFRRRLYFRRIELERLLESSIYR